MDMGLDLEWQQFLNNSDSSVTPCEATAKATATARAAVKPKVKPKVKSLNMTALKNVNSFRQTCACRFAH